MAVLRFPAQALEQMTDEFVAHLGLVILVEAIDGFILVGALHQFQSRFRYGHGLLSPLLSRASVEIRL